MGIQRLKKTRVKDAAKIPYKSPVLKDGEMNTIPLMSPSCKELGIPTHGVASQPDNCQTMLKGNLRHRIEAQRFITLPCGKLCSLDEYNIYNEEQMKMFPYPIMATGLLPLVELGNVRKRNERERERVRCVNEGYVRLQRHLPINDQDKRVSKVETLRSAINYIKYLQNVLSNVANLTDDQNDFVVTKK